MVTLEPGLIADRGVKCTVEITQGDRFGARKRQRAREGAIARSKKYQSHEQWRLLCLILTRSRW